MSVHVLVPECRANNSLKVANKFFKNVTKLKYLGMTQTNENCVPVNI